MDNERRVNKIHGILVEDSRVPELIKKVEEATPTVVVDSLPLENIKTNAIYAVKKIDYYTSFYGLHISPLTSMSDVNTNVLADLMRKNGWESGEITEALFGAILMMGLLPENLTKISNFKGHFINEYSDNLFKLKTYIADAGVNFDKSFEKLDDLYQYLFSDEYAQSAGLFTQNFTNTQAKLREHNFVWSEQALPDYQLGVVFTPVYEYYIYNGEEWKNVDGQIVVKQINTLPTTMETGIKFTEEETLKLAQGAKLYALFSGFGGLILIDCIEIGRQSVIKDGKAEIDAYYKLGLAFDPDTISYSENLIHIISTERYGTTGSLYCKLGTRVRFSGGFSTEKWVEVTNVPGYKYGQFIYNFGINKQTVVDVYFPTSMAATGNFAPFVTTGENTDGSLDTGFIIYAKEKLNASVVFSYDVEF